MYLSKDMEEKVLKRGSKIRYKIENLKFQNNEYMGISSIQGDYLGVLES